MMVANNEDSWRRELAIIDSCDHRKTSMEALFRVHPIGTVKFTVVGSSCQYLPQIYVVRKPRSYVFPERLAVSVTAELMETTC